MTKSVYILDQLKEFKSLDIYHFFVSGLVLSAKWLTLNKYVLIIAEAS